MVYLTFERNRWFDVYVLGLEALETFYGNILDISNNFSRLINVLKS